MMQQAAIGYQHFNHDDRLDMAMCATMRVTLNGRVRRKPLRDQSRAVFKHLHNDIARVVPSNVQAYHALQLRNADR